MIRNIQPISDCEEMIMSIIWGNENININELVNLLNIKFKKEWKPQTVCTFITRLKKKEFIDTYKKGRYTYYTPLVTIDEYRAYKFNYINKVLFNDNIEKMEEYVDKLAGKGWKTGLPCVSGLYLVTKVNTEEETDMPHYTTCHELYYADHKEWDCDRDPDDPWKVIAWKIKDKPYIPEGVRNYQIGLY